MPCDTRRLPNETTQMRAETIREKTEALAKGLANGTIKVKVGPQGAVAFIGWEDRGPVTDTCAYRRVMAKGSALAKLAIMKAEQAAGRQIDRKVVATGLHSHDGVNWHGKD